MVNKSVITKDYCLYHGDCCEVLPKLPDESVGLSIFSPPFWSMYTYTDSPKDMANSKTYVEFFEHFSFLVSELHRLTMPGRIVAVHCMDLPTYKRSGEEIGLNDFPGDIVYCFKNKGFVYHSRHCIWKDPLLAVVRTKAIGLAHKQIVKDSVMCRTGIPDYILAFRKPGENPKPVKHRNGLTEYFGSRNIPTKFDNFLIPFGNGQPSTQDQSKNKRSQWIWQQYASPVWFDIRQPRVLAFRQGKDKDDGKHICALQLDVVERCVELWSTKKDVVLTPFMGVGTEVYVAVKNGRKGVGIELKGSYFKQAIRNVKMAIKGKTFFSGKEE